VKLHTDKFSELRERPPVGPKCGVLANGQGRSNLRQGRQ
jgi:hypothetical protein